ncbi:hypothetical protein Q1695_011297 [Nippostrongylus brasiliensis]|nr:hypothetical protein Q1695_011297 [Nippostrongylus brasiliensis]
MASPVCVISKRSPTSADEKKAIHSIPCKLQYDGPAPVSGYFVTEERPDSTLMATFRGHGLQGVNLDLPNGYELCVLKKRGEQTYDVESRQKSFTLWEWDREAGKRSCATRALSQLRIAAALAED